MNNKAIECLGDNGVCIPISRPREEALEVKDYQQLQQMMDTGISNIQKSIDLLHRLDSSYHNLYRTYGVEPNTILVSMDVLQILSTSVEFVNEVPSEESTGIRIMGLPVIKVMGTDILKVAYC